MADAVEPEVAAASAVLAEHQRRLTDGGPCWCGQWPTDDREVTWMDHVAQLVVAAIDEAERVANEPCDAEIHSWERYRPEQIDSYWIRCTLVGPHDSHEDSNTGLTWPRETTEG